MRLSEMLLPTLREDPSEAEVISHKLMLRGGMIRKIASGIYSYLPMGIRAIKNVERIVREEMDRAGGQEILLPGVQPAELWQESGRWDFYGKELLRFKDRGGRNFCLGPTHEEVITDLVRREVRSYRQLPLNLYQIQTKFRDEIRPRFGLMRAREFVMKDAYSFDVDDEGAEKSYQSMYEAYSRIFERCGLKFRSVEADTGSIGGSFSHEFMVLADTGEDLLVSCRDCSYAANIEKAEAGVNDSEVREKKPERDLKKVATPRVKTIEEVCVFLKVKPENLVKTLIFETEGGPVAALVRGDCEINELKIRNFLGAGQLNLANDDLITEVTRAPKGFAGPVGLKVKIIADYSLKGMENFVTGGNEKDVHFQNVNFPRDFQVNEFADIRLVKEGDECPRCRGKLEFSRGIEVGHIFKLGIKYSKSFGAYYRDEQGKERLMVMGCYGIGIGRTVAAAIEQNHDRDGIIFPLPIAPFQVLILPINTEQEQIVKVAEEIYFGLKKRGIEVLFDDRKESPGIKFKDGDLIGIPIRITIGPKRLKEGLVELKMRHSKQVTMIKIEEIVNKVLGMIQEEFQR